MKIICKMRHGSHLYGTASATSDVDYKGVYLPELHDIILGRVKHTVDLSTNQTNQKNTSDDVDEQYYSLQKFIDMCVAGETIAIDMLHCNEENLVESSPLWEEIVSNRHLFYSKNMNAFLGYCKRQAAKYGIKGSRIATIEKVLNYLDTIKSSFTKLNSDPIIACSLIKVLENDEHGAVIDGFYKKSNWVEKQMLEVCGSKYELTMKIEDVIDSLNKKLREYGARAQQARDNQGVDWKAISHALRAAKQLHEIYTTGTITYPLDNADFLKAVKYGDFEFAAVQPILEEWIDSIEALANTTTLPETVNREYWDKWVVDTVLGTK